MNFQIAAFLLVAFIAASAQALGNGTICDKYTQSLLGENSGANQYQLVKSVVNTAIIGSHNETHAKTVGITVTGILSPGEFNKTKVDLLPYFTGGLNSTNRAGRAVAINFLDDGGAAPLMQNKPAKGEGSAQYKLISNLYSYFGVLLGCSNLGKDGFPAYQGESSQTKVHQFMDLNSAQIGYFVSQVMLSAKSYGVSSKDMESVVDRLSQAFAFKCAVPTVIDQTQSPQLQSICLANECPTAPKGNCEPYGANIGPPKRTNSTSIANSTVKVGEPKATESQTGRTKGKSVGSALRTDLWWMASFVALSCFTSLI